MRIYKLSLFILLFLLPTFSCEQSEEVDPFEDLLSSLRGIYRITITSYPRQLSQEGENWDISLYPDCYFCLNRDNQEIQTIRIKNFFGLANSLDCTSHVFVDNHRFLINFEDGIDWAGAPLWGEGTIIEGKFHFEGTILTSAGEFPVILDGEKVFDETSTRNC